MAALEPHLREIISIAREAGEAVLNIYNRGFSVEYKSDNSPLTEADRISHQIITSRLKSLSNIPILSEEGKSLSYTQRVKWDYVWIIDPLDGTKEFIKKNGEFTINIALIHNHEPVLGVVYAPASDTLYYALKGKGAHKIAKGLKRRLPIRTSQNNTLTVVASKSHINDRTKEFINLLKKTLRPDRLKLISKGSSLKLCMVAEGYADIYPRLAPTMEWDTAAADTVVREAGKMSYQYNENLIKWLAKPKQPAPEPLIYNKQELLNPWFVVV